MPDILTQQDGAILRITLNQPERGNAVSDEMVAELTGIIEGAEKTSSVVVLRGAGADFCVGRAINPMVVDGQTHGGAAQGIGQALWECCSYDAHGQLLSASFMD